MNRYPTVFVSFRQVEGLDFAGAYDMLTVVIANLLISTFIYLIVRKQLSFRKIIQTAA